MPKIVDHQARRRAIVDAMWRVVAKDGVGAISVRNVAAEAGMPKSTIGHYVGTQSELLTMAVREVMDSVNARVFEMDLFEIDSSTFVDALMEVIPTTPERRQMAQVWLLLVSQANTDPELQPILHRFNGEVAEGMLFGLTTLRNQGVIPESTDVEAEAHVLHGLVDGLSLQALTDPDRMPPARIRAALEQYVAGLQETVPA